MYLEWGWTTYIAQLRTEHKTKVDKAVAVTGIYQVTESKCRDEYKLEGYSFLKQSYPGWSASLSGIFQLIQP